MEILISGGVAGSSNNSSILRRVLTKVETELAHLSSSDR